MKTVIVDLESLSNSKLFPSLVNELEQKDKLFIITSNNGQIPVSAMNTLFNCKCKPDFTTFSDAENVNFALGLKLGLMSAESAGSLILLLSDDKSEQLKELNGLQFVVKGGSITIEIAGIKMGGKQKSINKPRQQRKVSELKNENTTQYKEDFPMNKPESLEGVQSKRKTRSRDITAPKELHGTVPEKFESLLSTLDPKGNYNLKKNALKIMAAVNDAIDSSITLELQLSLKLADKEYANQILPIISSKYAELKSML